MVSVWCGTKPRHDIKNSKSNLLVCELFYLFVCLFFFFKHTIFWVFSLSVMVASILSIVIASHRFSFFPHWKKLSTNLLWSTQNCTHIIAITRRYIDGMTGEMGDHIRAKQRDHEQPSAWGQISILFVYSRWVWVGACENENWKLFGPFSDDLYVSLE